MRILLFPESSGVSRRGPWVGCCGPRLAGPTGRPLLGGPKEMAPFSKTVLKKWQGRGKVVALAA